jgi:CheY-like chemotaxis protein
MLMMKKPTLLVVDDDKDLLRQLEFLLEDDFGKILLSSSKDNALELATSKTFPCPGKRREFCQIIAPEYLPLINKECSKPYDDREIS